MLGARQSLLALARALDKRFVPVVVCPRRGDLESELQAAGIATHIHKLPPWRKGKWLVTLPFHVWLLSRWVRKQEIRLVHANEIHAAPYVVRMGRWSGVPSVVHIRLSVTERQMRNYYLSWADRIVTVSRALAEPFRAWPEFEKKVRVIYNGLDVAEWRRKAGDLGAMRERIRGELGLAPDAFLVGQIGLISRRKQQHLVVEAAARLKNPKCHVLIVGDPSPGEMEYGREIAAAIAGAGLSRRVTMWPFRRDIAPVFAALDLNLLVSTDEGFGRVVIEAGALSVPTVGTRIGGIPEVIAAGETGLLIALPDAGCLASAIEGLAANEQLRRALGEAARRRVEREFTIEAHAKRVMELYEELLNH